MMRICILMAMLEDREIRRVVPVFSTFEPVGKTRKKGNDFRVITLNQFPCFTLQKITDNKYKISQRVHTLIYFRNYFHFHEQMGNIKVFFD